MINKKLWNPSKQSVENSNMFVFQEHINFKYNLSITSYSELHKWSIDNIDIFWKEVWDFSKIIYSKPYSNVMISNNNIWETIWFSNSKLNYAENLLKHRNDNIAIYFFGENQVKKEITFNQLYTQVSKVAFSFKNMGLTRGDRVAALMPNIPETVISMLAATSIGAVWSSCSPDFGTNAVLDRFSQIKPKFFIASDGYFYKNKEINCNHKINKIVDSLDSIEHVIIADYINSGEANWSKLLDNDIFEIDFEQLDFNSPLYIMYSSGTTGKPKSIVHSVGGTLLQHYKEHLLHLDLKISDKIFYYTTCGWMMWNWLVGSISVGASIVLYDGNPFFPFKNSLLKIMNDIDINIFGTSAKYISSLESYNIKPNEFNFKSLKTILSTGSVLSPNNYEFIYKHWKKNVQLSSISGGTDIISCFALGNPMLPVYKNELQCIGLGMSVKSYDSNMKHELGRKGELVCDKPFPSMPIGFWQDANNEKFIKSYFKQFNNVWRHGDYITINSNGGVIIYGRSDSTLNPGGIRIGTSEIYQVVEGYKIVEDSVAIGKIIDDEEKIILFVKLKKDKILNPNFVNELKTMIKNSCSPRHVPTFIIQVNEIPYTTNGKKIEIAIKHIVNDEEVANRDSMLNPECLLEYKMKVMDICL